MLSWPIIPKIMLAYWAQAYYKDYYLVDGKSQLDP